MTLIRGLKISLCKFLYYCGTYLRNLAVFASLKQKIVKLIKSQNNSRFVRNFKTGFQINFVNFQRLKLNILLRFQENLKLFIFISAKYFLSIPLPVIYTGLVFFSNYNPDFTIHNFIGSTHEISKEKAPQSSRGSQKTK